MVLSQRAAVILAIAIAGVCRAEVRAAAVCDDGIEIANNCVSKKGIYLGKEDKTYYFDDVDLWSEDVIKQGWAIIAGDKYQSCIDDIGSGKLTDDCACDAVCKTLASNICEFACDKLVDFELDIQKEIIDPAKDVVEDASDAINDIGKAFGLEGGSSAIAAGAANFIPLLLLILILH